MQDKAGRVGNRLKCPLSRMNLVKEVVDQRGMHPKGNSRIHRKNRRVVSNREK